jgi:thiol-disulfide isomerase/thioredoxin
MAKSCTSGGRKRSRRASKRSNRRSTRKSGHAKKSTKKSTLRYKQLSGGKRRRSNKSKRSKKSKRHMHGGGADPNDKMFTLKLFFMTGCGHCKAMKPEWNRLTKEVSDNHQYYKFDVEEYDSQNDNHKNQIPNDVRGFPTIRLYNNLSLLGEYSGNRDMVSILCWAKGLTEIPLN